MDSSIPEYIEARIRQRPPDGLPVVLGSTPVVAFGDARKAKVATLGLNPSGLEFRDRSGNELTGPKRRLETLSSLGVNELSSASPDVIVRVFEACNGYFHRCPYGWFDDLEEVLQPRGVSYFDGSACHLDLVQWATDPTWGKLEATHQVSLIEADLSFLRQQLSQEQIQSVFLNGSGVAKHFRKMGICGLTEKVIRGQIRLKLFIGRTPQGVRVVGWNENLQSSRDLANYPHMKAEYIKALNMAIAEELAEA